MVICTQAPALGVQLGPEHDGAVPQRRRAAPFFEAAGLPRHWRSEGRGDLATAGWRHQRGQRPWRSRGAPGGVNVDQGDRAADRQRAQQLEQRWHVAELGVQNLACSRATEGPLC